MATFFLAVHTRPAPGKEPEYHRWYDEFHLDEVLQVPDFVTAERYALVESDDPHVLGPGSHLAVFTVTTNDIAATMTAFRHAQKSMAQPDCLDADSVALSWWRPVGSTKGRHSHVSMRGKA
ncbi:MULTISPECIES: hypothetical protein [Streptomyces]|uniref:EthD protein n=1 Tax=Streptomyces chartreusis NRRL 3882 TaxID=1079985 RepID=A0A2N9B3A0_STRCX|nr:MULTISPECIES: hypothetical protein [Streptomyces]MYS89711.1 hypothetical protein [Streptomyces sp. SID5464]SOR77836.1 hypothetical protein SCNRRL3882_1305 [Streptomyces chartreusis NRRL 3882]